MESRSLQCEFLSEDMSGVKLIKKDIPDLSSNQILVKVKASSVNFPDYLMTQGKYQHKPELPFGLGMEGSGIIEKTGEDIKNYKISDEVTFGALGQGAFSDYVVVNENAIDMKPNNLSFEQAASFQTAYLTAYVSLVRRGNLMKGETLLVLGSSGGIGTASIQLAKVMGLKTICAVGSDEKESYVKSLGADEVIRYDQQDLKETAKSLTDGKGVDIVMDPVGGEASEQALRATGFNGRHLVIGFANGSIPKISLNLTLVKGVSIVGVWWGRWTNTYPNETAEDFVELISYVNENKLDIVPKNVYSLQDTSLALENFLKRKNIGKTVIKF